MEQEGEGKGDLWRRMELLNKQSQKTREKVNKYKR